MPLTTLQLNTLHNSLKQGTDKIAEELRAVFDGDWSLDLSEPIEYSKLSALEDSGLVFKLSLESEAVYLLIPEGPILPEWASQPEEEQIGQLEELAKSLEKTLLQDIDETDQRATTWSQNLQLTLEEEALEPRCSVISIEAYSESDPSSNQLLYLIVTANMEENVPVTSGSAPELETPSGNHHDESTPMSDTNTQTEINPNDLVNRVRRVLPLTVKVSVRVAEKKIDVGQLANLCPGTLIMFQKSCDDLLDLYVNNQHYAQGEAVKIGEKFGLKINAVGIKPQRPPGVFTL
ncbi:MAG TPA: hypothetical protein DD473_19105 [Planctomycetaceae bacterium]|nr:hypothetical protein [Planctomycetaceae bacterium]